MDEEGGVAGLGWDQVVKWPHVDVERAEERRTGGRIGEYEGMEPTYRLTACDMDGM